MHPKKIEIKKEEKIFPIAELSVSVKKINEKLTSKLINIFKSYYKVQIQLESSEPKWVNPNI